MTLSDKVRLVLIHILNSFIKRSGFRLLVEVRNLMATKTLIMVNNSIYTFIDDFEFLSKEHEKWIHDFFTCHSRADQIFIDIGAHIGKYSVLMAKKLTNGRVVAIEADPRNFLKLIRNITLNNLRNVIPLNCAVWKKEGKVKLFLAKDSQGHSLKLKYDSFISVPAKTLDSIVQELKLNRVDLVKVDVEGSTLDVLEGSTNTIKTFKPGFIIEVFMKDLKTCIKFLSTYNYFIRVIPDSAFCEPEPGFYIYAWSKDKRELWEGKCA